MGDLTDIRDRITRLTLAAGLPPDVWSELCKIDSDLRAAQAASAERVPPPSSSAKIDPALCRNLAKGLRGGNVLAGGGNVLAGDMVCWVDRRFVGVDDDAADRVAREIRDEIDGGRCEPLEAFEGETAPAIAAQLTAAAEMAERSTLTEERVRAVVRETAHARVACVAGWDGFSPGSINRMVEDIADRVAAQLTSPPPGHACPASYALGPDDLDLLQDLVDHPTRLSGAFGTRQVIRNILAAHRAPEPEDGPLPEVVHCGAVGCVSSIRKSYLPSGWVSIDGAWRCPRCKLEVPS